MLQRVDMIYVHLWQVMALSGCSLQCSESGRRTDCKCCSNNLKCLTLGTMPLQPNHRDQHLAKACNVTTAQIVSFKQ